MPTEAQQQLPPPPDPPRTKSDPPLRISAGGMEVAVKGAQAIYALALVVCFYLGGKVLPPAFDAVDKLTAAMKDSAAALAKVSADVADARAGVGRVEEAQARLDKRLGAIEADISELRKDLRRDLPRK